MTTFSFIEFIDADLNTRVVAIRGNNLGTRIRRLDLFRMARGWSINAIYEATGETMKEAIQKCEQFVCLYRKKG